MSVLALRSVTEASIMVYNPHCRTFLRGLKCSHKVKVPFEKLLQFYFHYYHLVRTESVFSETRMITLKLEINHVYPKIQKNLVENFAWH